MNLEQAQVNPLPPAMYNDLRAEGEGMTVPASLLESIPYFAGLSPAEARSLSSFFFDHSYQRGEIIILEGEPCRAVYFVASGSVKVLKTSPDGRELVLRIMRAGDSFNEVPVFDGGPNPATVVALEPTQVFAIPRERMEALVREYPRVAWNILSIFARRVRQMVTLAEDLSFRQVMSRLAKVLLEHMGEGGEGPRLTQQEIAALVGTAREMVSRSLKTLEGMGAIRMEGRQVKIVNPQLLQGLV